MFKSLQRIQHGINHRLTVHCKFNQYLLQKPIISLYRNFTEISGKDGNGQQLPDPHILVQDPNDPEGKVRYNTDNIDETEEKIEMTDEQLVEGLIVALEDFCPGVKTITDEDKQDMVKFVEKHKNSRLGGKLS